MKKSITLTAIILLSACSHQNPLKTNTPKVSAHFLMNASANAEKRLNFVIQKDSYGYAYLECMDGKKSTDIDCEALYNGIVQFAKEGHYSPFKSLELRDLNDQPVFNMLADDLAELAATTSPHFEK